MAKKLVMTLHGINSEGVWQERIRDVLEPHFKCISLTYDDYRKYGTLRLACDPTLFLVTLGVALLSITLGVLRLVPLWFSLICLPTLFWGMRKAYVARESLADRIKAQINEKTRPHIADGSGIKSPHFIGHSLGAFLIGTVLSKFASVPCRRIILAGSVLPSKFDWREISSAREDKFPGVRNEVGRKDKAVYLAGLMRFILPGLGNAGSIGHKEGSSVRTAHFTLPTNSRFIHDVDYEYGPCVSCSPTVDGNQHDRNAGKIHNIMIPKFTHSDAFIDTEHALEFWLPTLWGIQPGEFRNLRERCHQIIDCLEEDNQRGLREGVDALRLMYASWAGRSVGEFVESAIESEVSKKRSLGLRDPRKLVDDVIVEVARLISTAERLVGSRDDDASSQLQFLDPTRAVGRAVNSVVTT